MLRLAASPPGGNMYLLEVGTAKCEMPARHCDSPWSHASRFLCLGVKRHIQEGPAHLTNSSVKSIWGSAPPYHLAGKTLPPRFYVASVPHHCLLSSVRDKLPQADSFSLTQASRTSCDALGYHCMEQITWCLL